LKIFKGDARLYLLDPIPLALETETESREPTKTPPLIDPSLLESARTLIVPKALYRVAYVEERCKREVKIDGICFKSRVLGCNLEGARRVFPYLVTIGAGLETAADRYKDTEAAEQLDSIGNIAVMGARDYLEQHLASRFRIPNLSTMSPGSLPDWPLSQQEALFALFGGNERELGVALGDGLFMSPQKTVSGIFFPTEVTFHSCQLCPRDDCSLRRAPYRKDLARKYGLPG